MPTSKRPEVVTVATASETKKHIIRSIVDNRELSGIVVLHDDDKFSFHSALAKYYSAARKRMTEEFARTLDVPRRTELRAVLDGLPLDAFVCAYGEETPVAVIPVEQADEVPACTSLYIACAMQPTITRLIQRSTDLKRVVIYTISPKTRTAERAYWHLPPIGVQDWRRARKNP